MCPDFEQLCPTRRPLTRSYRRLIVWIAAAEFGTEPSVVGGSRLNCWPFALHCFRYGTGRDGVKFQYSKMVSARTHAHPPLRTSELDLPALCSSARGAFASLVSSRRRRDLALAEVSRRRWALAEDATRNLVGRALISSAAARAPLGWALASPRPHPPPLPRRRWSQGLGHLDCRLSPLVNGSDLRCRTRPSPSGGGITGGYCPERVGSDSSTGRALRLPAPNRPWHSEHVCPWRGDSMVAYSP